MEEDIVLYNERKQVPEYLRGDRTTTYGMDYIPNIRKADIDKTYIYRYFVMRSNVDADEIVEINKTQYNNLKSSKLHVTHQMVWRIAGRLDSIKNENLKDENINFYTGVLEANEAALQQAERVMPGIKYKITDTLQYYQISAK